MENSVRRRFAGLATAVGISALSATAAAADDYDPLDAKAVLANAEKTALAQGSGVLTSMGKTLVSAALDAYAPGLSQILGLTSGGEAGTQAVLDAIHADGEQTRALIMQFWDWARLEQQAGVSADYAEVELRISDWYAFPPAYRLTNREQLADLVNDCVAVMAEFQSAPHPWDRIDYLHAYTILLNLTVALQAERAELEIVGAAWDTAASGMTPANWWNGLSLNQRNQITADVASTKEARIDHLLISDLQISFAHQMRRMDEGSLPGGLPGTSDFEYARDLQFSPLTFFNDGGPSTWRYFVGRDPSGNCVHGTTYCKAYYIDQHSYNSGCGYNYEIDFGNGSGCYSGPDAAYADHKAVVLKDMIARGYGPVRGFAETWWDVWGYGGRERLTLDDELDAYLDEADLGLDGFLHTLSTRQTKAITPEQKSYLYGFAAAQGIGSLGPISGIANDNRDYLDPPLKITFPPPLPITVSYGQFPWWAHRNVLREWPRTTGDLLRNYRAVPAAKLVALGVALR
jgi:hypothetical protein